MTKLSAHLNEIRGAPRSGEGYNQLRMYKQTQYHYPSLCDRASSKTPL